MKYFMTKSHQTPFSSFQVDLHSPRWCPSYIHAVSAEHDLGLRELRASLSSLSRRGGARTIDMVIWWPHVEGNHMGVSQK